MQAIFQECRHLGESGSVVWRFDRSYLKPAHHHGQLEVLFVRRGTARLFLGTEEYELEAGALVWILPGTNHHAAEFSDDFDMWVLHCEPESARKAFVLPSSPDQPPAQSPYAGWMLCIVNACGTSPVRYPKAEPFSALDKRCAEAHERIFSSGSGELIQQLLHQSLLSTRYSTENASPSLSALASALVAEDLGLTRHRLCEALAIGPAHLARISKRAWGHGFAEQRSRSRVATFLTLCRQSELTLLQAGLSSGFGSYSQLHRTFRQITGFRPRDYVLGSGRDQLASRSSVLSDG